MAARESTPSSLYRPSLALLTDLYQLTMAYGYWKLGRVGDEAVFHLTFRKHPFDGGYTVAAGLATFLDYVRGLRFDETDLAYLAELRGNDDQPLFDQGFLDALRALELSVDIDAMPEGTAAFPHEPLVRVRGPLMQCQLLETPLLNMVNFQTLIATKAARVCAAAEGEPVLEFGLRRAQGIDGALSAARAAYIGGCAATSNVLAGRLFGIPVKGTHAHSWVMSFDDELESFRRYAEAMPNNCTFLVDTYDTPQGVRNAAMVGQELRERGHEMVGIRLDSGDLAYLGREARQILDEAGFPDAGIVASNELDEHVIASVKAEGSPINVWGVGTRLVTAKDDPALGGVYKLSMIRRAGGEWQHRVKLSEQAVKVSTPGVLQVRRYRSPERFVADAIYDERSGLPGVPGGPGAGETTVIVDPADATRRREIEPGLRHEDLLVPVMRGGEIVYDPPNLETIRTRVREQLSLLHPTIRRLLNPHEYPAGLALDVHELKTRLILSTRRRAGRSEE